MANDCLRRAMAEAEVGDDGYGDDPTVNALEEEYAERVGKPAALYVPSGTMANQIAVRVLCPPGALARSRGPSFGPPSFGAPFPPQPMMRTPTIPPRPYPLSLPL